MLLTESSQYSNCPVRHRGCLGCGSRGHKFCSHPKNSQYDRDKFHFKLRYCHEYDFFRKDNDQGNFKRKPSSRLDVGNNSNQDYGWDRGRNNPV